MFFNKEVRTMKSFFRECVSIEQVCELNNLDIDEVLDSVSDSEISYGNNDDTLVKGSRLEDILGKSLSWGDRDNTIFVSLGS